MPDKAYTVSPVYTEDATGQQVITDLEVSSGHNVVGRDGQYRGWEDDWTSDSQGRSVYDPKDNFDELGESPVVGFDEGDYTEALLESNPVIGPALDWASDGNMPDEFVDAYNKAVDSGNLDQIHSMLDIVIQQYLEHGGVVEEPEQEVDLEEPLSDEESTQFAEVLDELTEQEPAGMEHAYGWLEAAEQWQADPCMSAVCQATADFHNGSASATEVIDALTSRFTPRELAKAYALINQWWFAEPPAWALYACRSK